MFYFLRLYGWWLLTVCVSNVKLAGIKFYQMLLIGKFNPEQKHKSLIILL